MAIGIVMPLADQWFYSKVATSAEVVLASTGYDVIRYSLASLGDRTEVFKRLISGRRVDGLIVLNILLTEANLDYLSKTGCPIVTVETQTEHFPSVSTDNMAAARVATQHLVNLGHRQIAVISGLPDDPMEFSIPLERERGYRSVLREQDIEIRPDLNVPGNFSLEGGADAMTQLLAIQQPPTAVFAFSDEMAIAAMKVIRDAGLHIPGDISVIGFDDHDMAAYLDLTTIRQPVSRYGERAGKLLLRMLTGELETVPQLTLPTKLIVRNTTGPCRARSWGRS
jgi:DNA-binding LacI/PurR family transcriptional regulator